jgi:hypothetical protein
MTKGRTKGRTKRRTKRRTEENAKERMLVGQQIYPMPKLLSLLDRLSTNFPPFAKKGKLPLLEICSPV